MKTTLLNLIFDRLQPFTFEYERMNGKHFVVGIRFNRVRKEGYVNFINSFGLFYGYKYKAWQWLSNKRTN